MQVKRFVAANMRLALKMVREEMGPEAVILSNKRVAEGVELLTAIEQPAYGETREPTQGSASKDNPFQEAADASAAIAKQQQAAPAPSKLALEVERMQREAKQRARALAATLSEKNRQQLESVIKSDSLLQESENMSLVEDTTDFSDAIAAVASDNANNIDVIDTDSGNTKTGDAQETASTSVVKEKPVQSESDEEIVRMRAELQSMRDLLEQQLSAMAWGQFSERKPEHASMWKRLKRMGINAPVANALLQSKAIEQAKDEKSTADAWQTIMSDLCQRLPVSNDDVVNKGGVFAFVGPTGAGKTTTIGKLAARYVLEHGPEEVAMVTTDTMRIAAHEQLRTFGKILNVPVKVVDKHTSLERVLHSLRHKSLVLIDTAGLNRQDPRLKQQLMTLNELGDRIKSMLVLPTTSQGEVIRAAYHTYKTDNLTHCVLTKLDETTSLGEAFNLSIDKSLAVAYSTDGQEIPRDIAVATAEKLVRTAIEMAKFSRLEDDVMAGEMARLSRLETVRQRLHA